MYVPINEAVCMHVPTYFEAGVDVGCLPFIALHLYFWEKSLIKPKAHPIGLDWMTNKLQESSCLCALQGQSYTHVALCPLFWASEVMFSCLHQASPSHLPSSWASFLVDPSHRHSRTSVLGFLASGTIRNKQTSWNTSSVFVSVRFVVFLEAAEQISTLRS